MDKFLKASNLSLVCMVFSTIFAPLVQANELALGRSARTQRVLQIKVDPPIDLNFKAKSDVLEMRIKKVDEHSELLNGAYTPLESIFGRIMDKRPWWGLYGMHFYRQGPRSIEGPSKESYYLLNPYLLVAAEPINIGIWDETKTTAGDLAAADFPYFWRAGDILFDPANRIARLVYDVSGYHRSLKRWEKRLKNQGQLVGGFSMIAYNARDFGLNYVYLSPEYSVHVVPWQKQEPILITQMLHCGSSCGYPGGCNNMSPHIYQLDHNQLVETPARAYFKLWKEKPKSVEDPADFAVAIEFI